MSAEKPWLDQRQLFRPRNGLAASRDEVWARRHVWVKVGVDPLIEGVTFYAAPIATHPCLCSGIHRGTSEGRQCTLEATQEDVRCDECRQWCRYHDGRLFPDFVSNVVRAT